MNKIPSGYYIIDKEYLIKQTEGKFTEEQLKILKEMSKEFEKLIMADFVEDVNK